MSVFFLVSTNILQENSLLVVPLSLLFTEKLQKKKKKTNNPKQNLEKSLSNLMGCIQLVNKDILTERNMFSLFILQLIENCF